MHKQHANTDFSAVKQGGFSEAARLTFTKLTLNALVFPNLPVTLTALGDQLDLWDLTYGKPYYDAQAGELGNIRTDIETSLKENGVYVNSIAKGDIAALQKSGYPISKLHTPVGDLLPPASVVITNGTAPASFDIDIAKVEHAVGYLVGFTPVTNTVNDPNLWTIRWSKTHTNTFTGFVTGTQYKFAACGVAASNTIYWTNSPANIYAQ